MSARKPPVFGLEPWKPLGAQTFDHWDLWFLVALVADHVGDWQALRARLRERMTGFHFDRMDAEAKLSHLDDLERRVAASGLQPAVLLEGTDKRLAAKARDKLFRQHVEEHYKTRAMRETPRRLLHTRALRGHWPRFSTSPAGYEAAFTVERGPDAFHSERGAMGATRKLGRELAAQDERTKTVAERLALYRAFLTVHLDVMAHANDSCGTLGDRRPAAGLPCARLAADGHRA